MVLSDGDIHYAIANWKLGISPFEPKNVESASVDLTLGESFLKIKSNQPISLGKKVEYTEERGRTILQPKEFILATTAEYIKLPPCLSAFVEGRSSIGRVGLFIQNAGWVDPGFEGQITLELFNATNNRISLEPGIRICQLVLLTMRNNPVHPYNGKYQKQQGTTGSRINEDRENVTK